MTAMDSPHKSTNDMIREILNKQDKVNEACSELKKEFKDFRNEITNKVTNLDRKVSCHDVELQNVKENIRRYRNGTTGCSNNREPETEDDETEQSLIQIIKDNQTEQNQLLNKYNDTQKYIIGAIIGLVATICGLVIKLAGNIFGG